MRLYILGSSGALVSKTRDNCFFLLEVSGVLILIDCAGNPAGKIIKSGCDPLNLSIILLTHLHIDHCYGLPSILFHSFLSNRVTTLPIAVPSEDVATLQNQLQSYQLHPVSKTFFVDLWPVPSDQNHLVFESDQLLIHSMRTDHNKESRCYRITEKETGKRIVFSGDTRPVPHMVDFAKEADLLVHEASFLSSHSELANTYGHSTALDAAKIAAAAHVKRLMMVHFDITTEDVLDVLRAEADGAFAGHVIIPNDLDVFVI